MRMFCGERGEIHEDGKTVLNELRKFCQVDKGSLVVSPIQRATDVPASFYRLGLVDAYQHIDEILKTEIGVIDDDRPDYAER